MEILLSIWDLLSIPSIGSLIGIVGVLFAIVSILLTRSVSKISSHLEYKNLIGAFHSALPQNINITYDNQPVEKVSSSVFVIWNSGNKVINGDSLKTIDPLRIEACDDVRILRYNIQRVNNKTNNIQIYAEPRFKKKLLISFDFLEKKDGLRIEVLHTGSRESLAVKGTLIGVDCLNKQHKSTSNKTFRFMFKNKNILKLAMKSAGIITIVCLFLALIYSFIQPDFFTETRPRSAKFNLWFARVFLFFYSLFPIYLFYKIRPPYPSTLRAENNDIDS